MADKASRRVEDLSRKELVALVEDIRCILFDSRKPWDSETLDYVSGALQDHGVAYGLCPGCRKRRDVTEVGERLCATCRRQVNIRTAIKLSEYGLADDEQGSDDL